MKSTGNNNNNIDKLDYIKSKMCYVSKDMINRVKKQPMIWKKIFASNIYDKKGFICSSYKELLQLHNNKRAQGLIGH